MGADRRGSLKFGAVDPWLVQAWLTGRSLARALPPPVRDRGGFRIDTNSEHEICRWVFARINRGLRELGTSISGTRYFLKVCGPAAELVDALPARWSVRGGHWFMALDGHPIADAPLRAGYELLTFRRGPVTKIEIRTLTGELAASGYAAQTPDAFVYDRIETAPAHRRLGLARVVMAALGSCRAAHPAVQLLTATAEGEKLYSAMGWQTLSPYSTAYLEEA